MTVGRREQGYAALFDLLDRSTAFATTSRGLSFPLDTDGIPTELRDGFPALLFADGGDVAAPAESGELGRDCGFVVTVAVETSDPADLPTRLNAAIEAVLTALDGWVPELGGTLLSAVRYQDADGPFVARSGAPRAAMELSFSFELRDPAHETLAY